MLKALLFLYAGWYLGKTGIITDQSMDQLIAANKDVYAKLKADGVIPS